MARGSGLPDPRRWTSDGQNLVLAALVLGIATLVLVASRHGLGVTPDSVGYVAAARAFATDWQFTYWDGTPIAHWPPGIPLILGILVKVGFDPMLAALLLNVAAASAFIVLTYVIGRDLLASPRLALLLSAVLAIALTTVHVYSELWSEPLFLVLTLTVVWLLMRMVRHGVSRTGFVAVAVCVSLACSIRYIGVALLPVVGLSLVAAEARRGLPRALWLGAIGVLLSGIGAAAVVARNLILVGSPTGVWGKSHISMQELTQTTLATLGRWIVPEAHLEGILAPVAGLVIVGMAAYGAFDLARNAKSRFKAVPLLALVASYLLLFLLSELRVDGVIDERYLSPLLMPMSLLVVAGVRAVWRLAAGPESIEAGASDWPSLPRRAMLVGVVLILAGGVYFVGNARDVATYAVRIGRTGGGYNSAENLSSELARAAGSVPGSPGLLSNDPQLIYWVTGRHPIPGGEALGKSGAAADSVRSGIADGTLRYFAEFARTRTDQGVNAHQLRQWGVDLVDPVSYRDGVLYRMALPPGS